MALALTATIEPQRLSASLAATGAPAAAARYSFARYSPSSETWVGVRGAYGATGTGETTVIAHDYELPLDVELTYQVAFYDNTGAQIGTTATATVTAVWGRCEAWLVDVAFPANSFPVVIESMDELAFENAAAVHRVLGRRDPVLTTLLTWTPTAELLVLTDTEEERDLARAILGSGYPFLLRTSPELGIGNMFLGVTGFVEERFLTAGDAAQRRFRVSCVQVARPDPGLYVPQATMTYGHVPAAFGSYQGMKDQAASYDAVIFWIPDSPVLPWLPDDA